MKKENFNELFKILGIQKVGRYDVSDRDFALQFTDGFLDGSIGKLLNVRFSKTYNAYGDPYRITSLSYMLEKPRDITFPYYTPRTIEHKGGTVTLFSGFTGEPLVHVIDPNPKDCFGAQYEQGKIVAYKRDNRQIFGVVESISEEGRVKLRRIYNQSRQKNDYISFRLAQENLIIDDKLLNKLMMLRLRTE